MRLRKLALAVGATAALVSNLGFALGLGEIKLNSALNQPLDAQIKLLQVRDLSEDEILVRLASRDAYERANVERIFFLTGLTFEVVLDDPNNPYVRVTTKEDVREPYLNFLLETQWPTGRMLREYTVLMDLPTFSEKNQKAVAAPKQSEPQQVKPRPEVRAATPAPAVRTPAPASRPEPAPRTQAVSDGSYAVQANDTLWNIALMARPDRSYSVQQTMLAIQRLNPDAFINDNINLLKKGKVLRLPAADEIASLSTRQAINEVAYQNNQWSGGAALDASSRSGSVADRQSSREGRVQLSAGESSTDVTSGGGNSRQREILQNELAIAQEELGSARRQNSELVTRVEDLEAQITTMERMLEVTSEELRAMQLAAGQEVTDESTVAEPEVTPEPEVQTPEPVRPANTVVVAPKPEPTLMDMVLDNILYLALALVALLGGLFFWKRRSDAKAEQEEFDAFAEQDDEPEEEFSFPDDSDFDSAPEIEDQPVEPYEEVESAEAETADVAGEADIYIAYGKYDQAEDMLLKALDQEPGRVDVTLKLLEVYAETQNLEAFDSHYAGLLANGDHAARQRGEELRDSIPGAGEFDRTQVAALGAATAAASVSAFDLGEDEDPLSSLAEEGIDEADFDGLEGLDSFDSDFGDLTAEQGLDADNGLGLDLDDAEVSENIDELDFTLDGLDDADSEESFSLDLDDSGSAEDESLALDLDIDEETEEFSLDLDDVESDAPASLASAKDMAATPSDSELPMSFEADDDFTLSLDDELDLSLDSTPEAETETAAEAGLDSSEIDEFELSLDDEFTVEEDDELTVEEDDGFDLALEGELSLDQADTAPTLDLDEELTVEADDFDSEGNFGEMDLAALDQEMESLSADMDIDDDLSSLASESAASADDIEEFDISADLGIEEGADDLPPLASPTTADSMDSDLDDADAELGFLADSDEVATKLDLARAYIDMGDSEGAADILGEVMEEGDAQQKSEAQELLGRIG